MKQGGCEDCISATIGKAPVEVFQGAGTAGGDDGDGYSVGYRTG